MANLNSNDTPIMIALCSPNNTEPSSIIKYLNSSSDELITLCLKNTGSYVSHLPSVKYSIKYVLKYITYRLDHWNRDLTDMSTRGKITSPSMVLIAQGRSPRARDFLKGAHVS